MTTTSDAPPRVPTRPTPEPAHTGGGSRWRAAMRLAFRQVRRDWRTSILVVALVALPLSAVSAAAVAYDSHQPTAAERSVVEVGGADAWLRIIGGADDTRRQYLDEPYANIADVNRAGDPPTEGAVPASVEPFVPAGTDLLTLRPAQVEVATEGGIGMIRAVVGDIGEPVLDGHTQLLEGARPSGDDEAAVSPGALERLGARVGDALTLTDPEAVFTITGVMKSAVDRDVDQVLFLPDAPVLAELAAAAPDVTWFATGWAPDVDEIDALNAVGIVAYVPELAAAPGEREYGLDDLGSSVVLGALVTASLVFSAYLVTLLAGAAFAVSARRQQQKLAMVASVGATRGDIFRIVLLQGTALGAVGGIVGAAAGIGIGAALLPVGSDGSAGAPWGFHVPWAGLIGLVVFATAVGTASALLPARNASRQNVLGALRGARRPVALRRDRPLWGSLLMLAGIGATAGGALLVAAMTQGVPSGDEGVLQSIGVWAVVLGPVVLQVGVILAGHWILTILTRPLSRLGLGARLAGRDAAANPSRIVPAFGAIAACAFIASAALGSLGISAGSSERDWSYEGPVGSVVLSLRTDALAPGDTADIDALSSNAIAALHETGPTALAEVATAPDVMYGAGESVSPTTSFVRPALQEWVSCAETEHDPLASRTCAWPALVPFGAANGYTVDIAVVAPDDLERVLGTDIAAADLQRFADGAAVVTDDRWLTDDGTLILNTFEFRQFEAAHEGLREGVVASPQRTSAVDALLVEQPHPTRTREIYLAPDTAESEAIAATLSHVIATYDEPPTVQTMDRLAQDLHAVTQHLGSDHAFGVWAEREDGPGDPSLQFWLVVAGAGALVVGAGSVALGLSRIERRSDDATLAAVGASPLVRRAAAFWQGLIITGLGCITGTVAGIMPVWGTTLTGMGFDLRMADVPWPFLALLAVGLPLAIAVAAWLVPPREPDLSRRRSIA